jgi:hypothetical protein
LTHNFELDENTEREFIVKGVIGEQNNLYIRVYVSNSEILQTIEGEESSPSVSESPKTYIPAVSGLTATSTISGGVASIEASWTKQTTIQLSNAGNWTSGIVQNVVHCINDTVPTEVIPSQTVFHNAPNQKVTFSNLTPGNTYKIFVVAESLYTKGTRFTDSRIRKNYLTTARVAVGKPGRVLNPKLLPKENTLTVLYYATAVTGGISENFLR